MASYTTNLNLKKPAGSENVAIGDINGNMDTIDTAYGALNSKTTGTITKSTAASGGTLDSATLYKVGTTVFASGRIHSLNDVPTNNTFFIIPEGFRPATNTYVAGYMNIIHGENLGSRPVIPIVYANGNVSYSYSPTATTSQVYFSGSWSTV